jgi:hypothetical protein
VAGDTWVKNYRSGGRRRQGLRAEEATAAAVGMEMAAMAGDPDVAGPRVQHRRSCMHINLIMII